MGNLSSMGSVRKKPVRFQVMQKLGVTKSVVFSSSKFKSKGSAKREIFVAKRSINKLVKQGILKPKSLTAKSKFSIKKV